MKDIDSEISRCIIKLLIKEPFYAHFLSGIVRIITDGYAPEPKIKPPCSLFWCITKDGQLGNHLKYGRAIKMN